MWASWVESNLPEGRWEDQRNYVALCRFHVDGNPSMSVEVEKGVFVCRSCGARGRIERLAQHMELPAVPMVNDELLYRKLQELEDTQLSGGMAQPVSDAWLDQFEHWHPYWSTRFEDSVIERFRLGYDPATNSATIPWRNARGQVLGVIRRPLAGHHRGPKYIEPKGLPKHELLWGAWEIKTPPAQLVVVEGPVDAMSCWEAGIPAVALSGAQMTIDQARAIRRIAADVVYIGLDNDRAGRGSPAQGRGGLKKPASGTWRCRELLQHLELRYVVWSAKDPGDETPAQRLDDVEWSLDWIEWKDHYRRSTGISTASG